MIAFVQSCVTCQKTKSENSPYPGLLQPLEVPNQAWTQLSMDFIDGLPKSEGKNVTASLNMVILLPFHTPTLLNLWQSFSWIMLLSFMGCLRV